MIKKFRDRMLDYLPEGDAQSGIILIACSVGSLLLANLPATSTGYTLLWHHEIASGWSLLHFINDILMTIFFYLVGLEIKKELLGGELAHLKKAILPFFAALGGMLTPALFYTAFNFGTADIKGWGVPTATDIAFSIGILALLGTRIPKGLKVFLVALAIIDDLGAVVVIALFYSEGVSWPYILCAFAVTGALYALHRYVNFYRPWLWLLSGVLIWYLVHHSGIHATIAGVLLALATPLLYKKRFPIREMEHWFHTPVNKVIVPLFAIANTAIILNGGVVSGIGTNLGLGIILGLALGKPIGITLFTWIADKMNWAHLPTGVGYRMIIGVGMLAGIGFTMSLFVSFLAFDDPYRQDVAKLAIMVGSVIAGIAGLMYLKSVTTTPAKKKPKSKPATTTSANEQDV
jgi:Na+/H+ antiporter NhaA